MRAARLLRYAFMAAYSRTVWLLLVVVLACVWSVSAHAQSVCHRWTDAGLGLDVEGTPEQGCAAVATRFAAVFPERAPLSVSSCSFSTSLTVGLSLSNPVEAGNWVVSGVGACTADPPDPPASAASAVPLNWSNETHLLQALLIVACVFIFAHGINAGNKL
jgi:hypothetical protein